MSRSSLIGLAFGAVVGVLCLLVAVFAAGAGHGTYLPAKILFPFAMLASVLGRSITFPYVVLALAQFPLYGLLLGAAFRSPRFILCVIILSCAHFAVAAVDIFMPADDSFSDKPRRPSNQSMERTATRRAFAFGVAITLSLQPTLGVGGRRSSCSR
jgi:hypothetical protein